MLNFSISLPVSHIDVRQEMIFLKVVFDPGGWGGSSSNDNWIRRKKTTTSAEKINRPQYNFWSTLNKIRLKTHNTSATGLMMLSRIKEWNKIPNKGRKTNKMIIKEIRLVIFISIWLSPGATELYDGVQTFERFLFIAWAGLSIAITGGFKELG